MACVETNAENLPRFDPALPLRVLMGGTFKRRLGAELGLRLWVLSGVEKLLAVSTHKLRTRWAYEA